MHPISIALVCLVLVEWTRSVKIFHLIDNENWGETDGSAVQGHFNCPGLDTNSVCEVLSSDCKSDLVGCLRKKRKQFIDVALGDIVVSLYHIHSWGLLSKWPHAPDNCLFPSHYSMVESEESHGRFHKLFDTSFKSYDGNSTTHPDSTVPRTYFSGLNNSEFLPMKSFSNLIKGASFVASTCHRVEGTTKRIAVVNQLQSEFRVDSLGRCHTTRSIPEGIVLRSGRNAQESLRLKQEAISHYMFYCAFENTYERGYVTEKVFDALIAGVVPIYLGPSEDCRQLLPHPKAAIFLDDFDHSIPRLAAYLKHLAGNETAYEVHRAWRADFNPSLSPRLFAQPWPCRICEWAVARASQDVLFRQREERMQKFIQSTEDC